MTTSSFILNSLLVAVWLNATYGLDIQRKSSYFQTERIANVRNITLVTATFTLDESDLCAYKCATFSSTVSLYFDEESKQCYCNNQQDNNRVSSAASNSLVYSSIVKTSLYVKTSLFATCVDCDDLYNADFRITGPYEIQELGSTGPREMYCDLAGEWIVFQKRFDGSVDFYRDWDDYVFGFGSASGEYWLGLEAIHTLTSAGSCELLVHLEAQCYNSAVQSVGYARYAHFSVDDAASNYTLHVSGFSGNVGDCLGGNDGHPFTTFDADNDADGNLNCAATYKGGWWYSTCGLANLNGQYLQGSHTTYFDGMEWSFPWGFSYSLLKTEMKLKCG